MATGVSKTKWNGDGVPTVGNASAPNGVDAVITYEGKRAESEILATKAASPRLLWESSQQAENRLYYGDNLPVLAYLLDDRSVAGRIRLVYIDPPFSTRSVFQSRSQIDAYQDLLVGSRYLEFLRERLVLLRELLAKDGAIYVHLDDNIAFYVKVIMDEVFGRRNFRNWITRKKCNPKNYTRRTYGNVSDYILFYTKSDTYAWNRPYDEWRPERAEREYSYVDTKTGRRYKKVPIHAPGVRHGKTGNSWRGMMPPPGKHWQYTPSGLDEMDARGEIYWSSNGNPRRKVFLDDSAGVPLQDIWLDFRDAHNQMIRITGYPTEKNPELLRRIVQASSNPGDLVLDCFSGSGTSLAVASELGRRWIGIDSSRVAIETTLRRFARGLERMGDFVAKKRAPQQGEVSSIMLPAIKDFSLYATESCDGELGEAVAALDNWTT